MLVLAHVGMQYFCFLASDEKLRSYAGFVNLVLVPIRGTCIALAAAGLTRRSSLVNLGEKEPGDWEPLSFIR